MAPLSLEAFSLEEPRPLVGVLHLEGKGGFVSFDSLSEVVHQPFFYSMITPFNMGSFKN
jgi:hypothetical protein